MWMLTSYPHDQVKSCVPKRETVKTLPTPANLDTENKMIEKCMVSYLNASKFMIILTNAQ
jgi:hypothetical protein